MSKLKTDSSLFRFVLSFIVSTLLFVLIFSIAYSVSYSNYVLVRNQGNLINQSISEINALDNVSECNESNLFVASDKLDLSSARLNLLEDRFGKNDKRVLEQKKLYSDLMYQHFLLVEKYNTYCDSNFSTIFFFYSNFGDFEKESESMGFIVSSFKSRHYDNVMVYSFDYDLNYSLVSNLKEEYEINEAPIAIVNEDTLIYVRNINDLENIVFQSNKQ